MKIALQIPGLLREYEKSFKSLKKTFDIEGVDLDLYIHTWETDENAVDDKWGINSKQVETVRYEGFIPQLQSPVLEVINKVNNIIPIVDYKIESQIDNEGLKNIKTNLGSNYSKNWSPHNLSCQLYSMYQCNKLRKNSNKEYDLVIRARTELLFEESITLNLLSEILDNSKDTIAVPKGANFKGGINDMIAIGSPEALDWYCAEGLHYENGENPHVMVKKHILKKYKVSRFKLPYTLRGSTFGEK